ncbi:insulinase family protein [Myxacorys almedinensis A]|uniref:Insulinase family protein n=2 Tax=Myxacorys TaxID=2056239 RepID=A0A8J7Z6W9_9CYAN|nr:pitrilysin family protein [Myxacorys almedinensis]NDJ16605.1 insulinase family protein [Myxacorys almedinensis A]
MTSILIKSPKLNSPTVHRLPNGLTIIAEQIPVDAVNLNVWLNVGSAIEPNAINGMAHFLEHMIFKGTQRLKSGEFEQQIEQRGAVTNAATSQDYTHYYITTAPKDFAELAPLQLDVLLNASIPDEGFERERFVVLEEIRRSEDNPRRRSYQRMAELTFETLPYRRQVLGPTSVIEQLVPQQMRDFHSTWYRPASMTAVAVGNLPVDRLIHIIEESVTQLLPASSHPVPDRLPNLAGSAAESPFTHIVRQEYVDPALKQARLMMLWRVPGLTDIQNTYELDVLTSVLGQGRTARLVKDLREERGLVSSVSASNLTYLHQGVFAVSAQLPVEHVEAVEAAIVAHIQHLQSGRVTESEMARVQTQVANHFTFGNETPSDRAGLYGYYQTLVGGLEPAFNYSAAIQSLSASALQTAAQTYLPTNAYGIVVIKPGES